MKIYLEVLIFIIIPFSILILWWLWFKYSRWRLFKKYKPENDKARKGGEQLRTIERTELDTSTASESINGFEQPKRRRLLPTANVNNVGENCSSNRKLLRRRN